MRSLIASCIILLCTITAIKGQSITIISGTVKNKANNENLSSVSITVDKTNDGTYSDEKGNFKLTVSHALPLTIVISSVGYDSVRTEVTGNEPLIIALSPAFNLGADIVVAATRQPERLLEAPVTIERVSAAKMLNEPGASYYDAVSHLKGVDITTSGYLFKTISTRGFNGSGNLRFNQLVDGMDNNSPALNFSVGNIIGVSENDIDNMELLSGASSALYGSGGMNGTLLITSKDPFKYQGISAQVKEGVNHIGDSRQGASAFHDVSLRWGQKLSEKFAFKVAAEFIKTDDWQANDSTDLLRNNIDSKIKTGTRATDINYDGVNVYGDEVAAGMESFAQVAVALATGQFQKGYYAATGHLPSAAEINYFQHNDPNVSPFTYGLEKNIYGSQVVSRTGYQEKYVVDYNTYNVKVNGGIYYKINGNTEASLTANWGTGTIVTTGSDRYSLKNFSIGQYKAEVRSKNWFIRSYTTQENSGDSYASTLASIGVNNTWKKDFTWLYQYIGAYSGARLPPYNADINQANDVARIAAESGRFLPGEADYKHAFDSIVKVPISKGGAQFLDKSDMYQTEGQINLTDYIKVLNVIAGASYRLYNIDSKGTLFADTNGTIKIHEYGAYLQLQKSLLNDVLTLTASGRYDKNKNFNGRFTPRVTASVKVIKNNFIRLSYQQAYRFPSNQDQYITLKTPASVLLGGLPSFKPFYHFDTNPVFTAESVINFRDTLAVSPANAAAQLRKAPFVPVKPESMQSFEIGYRGVIAENLLVDAYYYYSRYKNFIGRTAVARGNTDNPDSSVYFLASPFTTKNFSFVTNSDVPIKEYGWGIGLEYRIMRNYSVNANVYSDALTDIPDEFVTFFNTPKYRFNLGVSGNNIYKGFGFNINYKWQDDVNWEGTFGTGRIKSFGVMDATISYKIEKINSQVKLGASNLFNNYYRNSFGNPYIGGLYYVSFGYNIF